MTYLIGMGVFGLFFLILFLEILENKKLLPAKSEAWYFVSGALCFTSFIVGPLSFDLVEKELFVMSCSMFGTAIYTYFRAEVLDKKGLFYRPRKPPNYDWVCSFCDKVNKENTSKCKKCMQSVI